VAAAGSRDVCEACTADADCGAGGVCLGLVRGAMGVCATEPSSGSCRSGFQAGPLAGAAAVCAPPRTFAGDAPVDACARMMATFGAPCFAAAACQQDLAGGSCQKPSGASQYDAGVCTVPCQTDSDCPRHVDFGKCSAGFCSRG
jgi:hypothetical protein